MPPSTVAMETTLFIFTLEGDLDGDTIYGGAGKDVNFGGGCDDGLLTPA